MRKSWWMTAALGVSLLGVGGVLTARAAEEENEVKVKLTDCPKAVQEALTAAAAGAKIGDVDKETSKDGKTIVYETDVKIDGKTYEIKVAEDGKLISKKVEDEEGDKKDGDKKDEKKEEKEEKK